MLEDLPDALGRQVHLLLLRVLVDVLPLARQLQTGAPNRRLVPAATAVPRLHNTSDVVHELERSFFVHQLPTRATSKPIGLATTANNKVGHLFGGFLGRVVLLADVHLVAALANVFALAQVVDVRHALPRLALRLHNHLLDLRVVRTDLQAATRNKAIHMFKIVIPLSWVIFKLLQKISFFANYPSSECCHN